MEEYIDIWINEQNKEYDKQNRQWISSNKSNWIWLAYISNTLSKTADTANLKRMINISKWCKRLKWLFMEHTEWYT